MQVRHAFRFISEASIARLTPITDSKLNFFAYQNTGKISYIFSPSANKHSCLITNRNRIRLLEKCRMHFTRYKTFFLPNNNHSTVPQHLHVIKCLFAPSKSCSCSLCLFNWSMRHGGRPDVTIAAAYRDGLWSWPENLATGR